MGLEQFFDDLLNSGLKAIYLPTGDIATIFVNEHGGMSSDVNGEYMSITSQNYTTFLPLVLYLERPDIKPLFLLFQEMLVNHIKTKE